jgi:hypothetical protein
VGPGMPSLRSSAQSIERLESTLNYDAPVIKNSAPCLRQDGSGLGLPAVSEDPRSGRLQLLPARAGKKSLVALVGEFDVSNGDFSAEDGQTAPFIRVIAVSKLAFNDFVDGHADAAYRRSSQHSQLASDHRLAQSVAPNLSSTRAARLKWQGRLPRNFTTTE